MMLLPRMTVAGPVFMTDTLADVVTVVVTVEVLLLSFGVGSVVVVAAVAVSLSVDLSATLALTWTVTVMVCEAPAAKVLIVSLMTLPVLLRVNCGPLVDWLCDTTVSPGGKVAIRAAVWASLGP